MLFLFSIFNLFKFECGLTIGKICVMWHFSSVLSLTCVSILVENGHITVELTSQWKTDGKDLSAYILAIRGSPEPFDNWGTKFNKLRNRGTKRVI